MTVMPMKPKNHGPVIRGDDSDVELSDDEDLEKPAAKSLNMDQFLVQLREAFQQSMDVDDDTRMSKIQFQIVLRGLNTTLEDQYLENIVDKMEGKNGQVNFDEFCKAVKIHQNQATQ